MSYKFYKALKDIPDLIDKDQILVLISESLYDIENNNIYIRLGHVGNIKEHRLVGVESCPEYFNSPYFKSLIEHYERQNRMMDSERESLRLESMKLSEKIEENYDEIRSLRRLGENKNG